MNSLLILSSFLFISALAIGNPFGGGKVNSKDVECPLGYKKWERDNNRWWCMKYFSGNETFFEAEKTCRCQGGATLSGIENHRELQFVIGEAEAAFKNEGTQSGGVWVGAYRRKECRVENMESKSECTKENQYQWTDRNTIGKMVWTERWAEGAPHNNKVGSHQEFCVQLQVSIDPAVVSKENTAGYFDNRVCVNPVGETPFPSKGFVCGRPAKIKQSSYYGGGGGGVYIIGAAKPTKKP